MQETPLFSGQPITPSSDPRSVAKRITRKVLERERVLSMFETLQKNRLRLARSLAEGLASKRESRTITGADVQAEFYRRYGAKAWESEAGTTHWTGAIFRGQKQWECLGVGLSPFNHSSDNRIWRLREE